MRDLFANTQASTNPHILLYLLMNREGESRGGLEAQIWLDAK